MALRPIGLDDEDEDDEGELLQEEELAAQPADGGGGVRGDKHLGGQDPSMSASFWEKGASTTMGRKSSKSAGLNFLDDEEHEVKLDGTARWQGFWANIKKWFKRRSQRVVTNGKRTLHPSNTAAIFLVRVGAGRDMLLCPMKRNR